jgi:hypothetical protein
MTGMSGIGCRYVESTGQRMLSRADTTPLGKEKTHAQVHLATWLDANP